MADTKDDNAKVKTLTDEVDKAEAQLTQSMYATAQLHVLWRSHLFRMSLLVLAIALSQCRTPTMECIKNIKATENPESRASGLEASLLILKDTAPEIMGIIMVVCLAAFLSSTEHTKLTSVTYMAATMFVPLQLALFFQKSTMGCSQVNPNHALGLARQFPISVVFHVITTLCCILMEHQMRVRMDDLREIRNLRVRIKEKVQEAKKSK